MTIEYYEQLRGEMQCAVRRFFEAREALLATLARESAPGQELMFAEMKAPGIEPDPRLLAELEHELRSYPAKRPPAAAEVAEQCAQRRRA